MKTTFFICSFIFSVNCIAQFGIRQTYGSILDKNSYKFLVGKVTNYKWKDIEIADNVWDWTAFDAYIKKRVADNLPTLIMIFTKGNSPGWLYTTGNVPKVIEYKFSDLTDSVDFSPYWWDSRYRYYFERMVNTVADHLKNSPYKNHISCVQGAMGEEGDFIGYRGFVQPKYEMTSDQFDSLFREFSQTFYNAYSKSSIPLMVNAGMSPNNITWFVKNCPNGWLKLTPLGKVYQMNDEKDRYKWLGPYLNERQPQDTGYIRARSDMSLNNEQPGSVAGWFSAHPAKNLLALFAYMIHWGMDWSDQAWRIIINPDYAPALRFFKRYAGEKDTAQAMNAMCYLRDGLDADDEERFPVKYYGSHMRSNKERYKKIAEEYAPRGALLQDIDAAMGSSDGSAVSASGINDVGWNIFPGNYERYLHQISPNKTSVGYWNVVASNDTGAIYGRFARGFDIDNGKDALYFDVDPSFYNESSHYTKGIKIIIRYLDAGKGSFRLYYDGNTPDIPSILINCTETNTWKKASVTLYDATFTNKSLNNSDFYIKSEGNKNVIFALIDLRKINGGATIGYVRKRD